MCDFTGGKDSRGIISSIIYNKLNKNVIARYGDTDISSIDTDFKDGIEEKPDVDEYAHASAPFPAVHGSAADLQWL